MTIDPKQLSYGDLPGPRTDGYKFDPLYDVLVFIRLNADGSHVARIHYFNATGCDFASMQGRMEAAIAFLQISDNIDQIPPGSLNCKSIRRSFQNFAFSAQSNILLFVDNGAVQFRDIPLFFTGTLKDGREAAMNKSFYDAEPVALKLPSGAAHGAYLRNYFTNGSSRGPGENPIGKSERYIYAFNFNLSSADADDCSIVQQVILDPDGGNMGSGGPPP